MKDIIFFKYKNIGISVIACALSLSFVCAYYAYRVHIQREIIQLAVAMKSKEKELFISDIEKNTTALISPSAEIFTQEEGNKIRIERWELMRSHKEEIEKYLISSHASASQDDSKKITWENIMTDYILLSLGNVIGHITLDSKKDIVTLVKENITFHAPVSGYIHQRKNGHILFEFADNINSGAYNINSYWYSITFDENHVVIKEMPFLSFQNGVIIKEQTQMVSGGLGNIRYDEKSDDMKVYGFLPFGRFPCNSVLTYSIAGDRFIFEKEEEKVACIGKKIESLEDLDKYFINETDFNMRKIVRESTQEEIKKMQVFDVTKK